MLEVSGIGRGVFYAALPQVFLKGIAKFPHLSTSVRAFQKNQCLVCDISSDELQCFFRVCRSQYVHFQGLQFVLERVQAICEENDGFWIASLQVVRKRLINMLLPALYVNDLANDEDLISEASRESAQIVQRTGE